VSDRSAMLAELIKYPIIIFSIVIGLAASKSLLGLEFGAITEVTTGGVRFAEKSAATDQALTVLEGKVNQALVELEQLRKIAPASAVSSSEAKSKLFEAAQTVSDQTARVQSIQVMAQSDRDKPLRGYMWIGNFDRTWSNAQLATLADRQPVTMAPNAMQPGTEYVVLGNVVVRDGLPSNDRDYYKNRGVAGVVSRGDRVRLLSAPQGVDREYAVQYWAEIEALSSAN
jgi:hypothetical protein